MINVGNLVTWSATNAVLRPLSSWRGGGAADVQSVYVDDQRNTTSNVVSTVYTYGTNYSTNTATTSSLPPQQRARSPPITSTNTTGTTTTSRPSSETSVGSLTNLSNPTRYSYAKITGYTYNLLVPTISTNTGYVTNVTTIAQPGIVLSNGAVLPPQGLSVATPDPAYIIGNWNVQLAKGGASDAGTNSTTYSLASAVFADAITVLSSAWNPANSTAGINSRVAAATRSTPPFSRAMCPTTAAPPDTGMGYSGGVENFPRFLENWSSVNFYYNGSMVCMFPSQIANYVWPGTGTVYNPPNRYWAYDTNFNNPNRQPPMMPHVITIQRSKWALLAPYATSF